MMKEKLIGELDKGYISKVVRGYCEQVLNKIDSIKKEDEAIILDNFYNLIQNDKQSMLRMEAEAKIYKDKLQLNEYISQMAMITIYKNFTQKLILKSEDLNIDDYESIKYMEDIFTRPYDYCEEYFDEWVEGYIPYDFFTILGMRIEYFAEEISDGEWINRPKYIITLKWQRGMRTYYELEIFDTGGGVDEYGYCNLKLVHKPNITMSIKEKKMIKLPRIVGDKDIRTLTFNEYVNLFDFYGDRIVIGDVFEATSTAGDNYYPMGYVDVNTDLYEKPNSRQKDKRVVWIFKGDSGTGKTYLSNIINNESKSIYDTDTDKELPDKLIQDIIVIGNKYEFSVEDVKQRIVGDSEVVVVDFRYCENK